MLEDFKKWTGTQAGKKGKRNPFQLGQEKQVTLILHGPHQAASKRDATNK